VAMSDLKWWQQIVFYQIYPRSFADGNGDGIGDFPGITSKLDYLRDLGIGGIWLSPHFPSPLLDCGYDVSDYSGVAPEYGTLDDFRTFLNEAHARNIRVILDLVLNHSSDQHPWFIESRSSLNNPKRDWYVWRDGKNGGPPNNWASIFGGSAWEKDGASGQYYYHAFLREQPDLNWRNPEVKAAMWDEVRFWLDMGVDGFRLDAVATLFEDPDLPDHPFPTPTDQIPDPNSLNAVDYEILMQYQIKQPGMHELMQDLRALLDAYPGDRMLVGEDDDVSFHGVDDNELNLVFNFPLMHLKKLTPAGIRANQAIRLAELPPGAWPCNTLGNHDTSRNWSRYGDSVHDAALTRMHLALMLTLKGTPFLYYGEEIGMTNARLGSLSQIRDTTATNLYQRLTGTLGMPAAEATEKAIAFTRDRCRTPMQWNAAANSGFSPSGVETWLPVSRNYASGVNVAAQQDDPASLLNFYRRLIRLRQSTPALIEGDYEEIDDHNENVHTFLRSAAGQICLIALNFSSKRQPLKLERPEKNAALLFSSASRAGEIDLSALELVPFEILIAQLH
jgi:alpha-glucosidase